jgi:DNA-binding NarL/FixJ family response regulator
VPLDVVGQWLERDPQVALWEAVVDASDQIDVPLARGHRREREVATLLAQGLSNPEIAAALVLSPYTVRDHIRSLFEKTQVGSRQELVARIFLNDYMPRIARRTPLTSTGAFAE